MKNFVVQFNFGNVKATELFRKKVEMAFSMLKKMTTEEYTYYLVKEFSLPSMEDIIDVMMDAVRIGELLSAKDYVAVYSINNFAPEKIQRDMVVGKSDYIDQEIKKSYLPEHFGILDELLNYKFVVQS